MMFSAPSESDVQEELVHISQIANQRIVKVTNVLTEGQDA
jgi:predicted RNA-binding protein with RPS1 domain